MMGRATQYVTSETRPSYAMIFSVCHRYVRLRFFREAHQHEQPQVLCKNHMSSESFLDQLLRKSIVYGGEDLKKLVAV